MSESFLKKLCDIRCIDTEDDLLWAELTIDLSFEGISSFDLVFLVGEMDSMAHELMKWVNERGYKIDERLSKPWHSENDRLTWSLVLNVRLESYRRKVLLMDKVDEMGKSFI